MPSRFSLEAVLSLNDQLTGQYRQSTRRITALNQQVGRSISRMNDGINRATRRVVQGGLLALGAGVALATREFIALDDSITQAGAKFKDLDTTSSDYAATLEKLSMAARDVGSVTEFSATDAAGALDKMAMAGLTSEQSMALLMQTTNLATAAGTDLTQAVDIATDSLGAFNLMTEDAAQLQTNLTRISDVMAKTTTTANTSLEDMFESVKAGAPAFTAAGQSVESFAALTGVMANAGVKGSTAGTNLRNIMLKLADPTAEAAKQLEALGIQTSDEAGNFRDIVDILADFEKGLDGMGTAQRTAALSTVFGARSVTGVNILIAEGSDALRDYRSELENSAGASRTMAEAMRNSLGNRIKVLRSALTELGLKFVDAFDEQGREALDRLIEGITNFDPKPVIDFLTRGAQLMFNLARRIRPLIPVIIALVAGIKVLAIAQSALNLVMLANPYVLIAAALTTLIVLIVTFREEIGKALRIGWGWVKQNKELIGTIIRFTPIIGQIIGAVVNLVNIVINLIKRWDEVKAAFQDGGILAAIRAIGQIIWDTIVAPIQQIIDVAKSIVPSAERREERRDRRDERRENRGGEAAQASAVQQQRITEESRQRNDVFLHAPMGGGLSTTPGGAPSPSVQLGGQ